MTASAIPGDNGWPLFGHTLKFLFDFERFSQAYFARYGDIARVHILGMDFIAMCGPEANQLVLQNRDDLFRSAAWERLIGPFFHRGLMLLDGDEHRLHRRVMQAVFTSASLRQDLAGINTSLAASLAGWPSGDGIKVYPLLKTATLDVATRVFMGNSVGADAARLNRAFLDAVRAGTGIIRANVPGTRWRRGLLGRKLLDDYFRAELPARRASGADDLFARLCRARTDDGALFSDDDVISHLAFLLMAAHDTSTIALSNMIYQLARHPHWQERLREESRALGHAVLEYEDLERLPALDWVMKEALRIMPPVAGVPREAARDFEFGGHRVAAGSLVTISMWMTHRLPQFWKEPERFDPERFAPARAEDKQHAFLWVPFGGGAHKCIGMHFGAMEVKAALHQLLLSFRWSVPEGYVLRQDYTSLPTPGDGLPVRLERLQSKAATARP
jgi:cytochrome P450